MKNLNENYDDFEIYSKLYQNSVKEILVLTSDQSGAASKFKNSWNSSQYFLAYIDLEAEKLMIGEGRLNWLIADEIKEKHGISYPFNFKEGTIYHLKVRELLDKTVPEGRLPSAYNSFMVVEIMNENIQNDQLQNILIEYRKPIKLFHEQLGEFELNKDYGFFSGSINWINNSISVLIEVDNNNQKTWNQGLENLLKLAKQQEKRDLEFRTFASEKLTELANDWLEEDQEEITKRDFINRISLSELIVNFNGDYTAYYDDDDMFYGHVIDVSGNLETGIKSSNIAG